MCRASVSWYRNYPSKVERWSCFTLYDKSRRLRSRPTRETAWTSRQEVTQMDISLHETAVAQETVYEASNMLGLQVSLRFWTETLVGPR